MLLLLKTGFPKYASLALPLLLLSGVAGAATPAGKAVSAGGDVLVRNEGGSAPKFRKLKSGDEIFQGDVVNTASNASAKLLMKDRSILDLGGSTLFKVDEFELKNGGDRKVTMTMSYGTVRAAVNTPVGNGGKYNIRTKTATMGVRGTEFIIASDLGEIAPPPPAGKSQTASGGAPKASTNASRQTVKTQITVIEGKVEVSDQAAPKKAPVAVTKGEQLTTTSEVSGDKAVAKSSSAPAPKVVELTADQMKSTVQQAKIEDKTFKQAVVIDPSSQGGPSSGLSTLAEVSSTFGTNVDAPPGFGQIGTPGTFGAGVNPVQVVLPPGSLVNVQVVFKK
jgi:hypothetical protein